jgi:hypothetical protein
MLPSPWRAIPCKQPSRVFIHQRQQAQLQPFSTDTTALTELHEALPTHSNLPITTDGDTDHAATQ